MPKETISLRIEQEKRVALDAIASGLDRDRSYIINEAIDTYLELHQWQVEQIQKAVAEADAGKFASDEEVEAFFAKWTDEED
jgi:predicted transcriptional regulator